MTKTITKARYEELLAAEIDLQKLHNAGVDNWEGYDEAMESDLDEDEDEDEEDGDDEEAQDDVADLPADSDLDLENLNEKRRIEAEKRRKDLLGDDVV